MRRRSPASAPRGVVTVNDIIGRLFPETVRTPEPVPVGAVRPPSRRALGTAVADSRRSAQDGGAAGR